MKDQTAFTLMGGPILDGLEFSGIHLDGARRDKEAEVFDLSGVKGTL